jgi:hypothetical protein
MRIRSSSLANILEQPRKRRISHQQREIELLLETAGFDRPDTTNFEGSTFKRTRRRAAELPSKSSRVQVIIRSNEPRLRASRPQTINYQPKKPLDINKSKWEDVDFAEEDNSRKPETRDSSTQTPEEEDKDNNSVEANAIANPVPSSKKRNEALH